MQALPFVITFLDLRIADLLIWRHQILPTSIKLMRSSPLIAIVTRVHVIAASLFRQLSELDRLSNLDQDQQTIAPMLMKRTPR